MVTADISQLSGECNVWRESLRSYRDEINQLKGNLQQAVSQSLSKEQLKDVEHYHNQFIIQLKNVHDLKQAIKAHDRRVNFEMVAHKNQLSEDSLSEHEKLFEEYQTLDHTLLDLKNEFSSFINRTS